MAETAIEKASLNADERGLQLSDIDGMFRFAQWVLESKLAPEAFDTPAKVIIAVQTGLEAGFTAMASLRAINVIKGTPSWKVEAALAMVRRSGRLKAWETPTYSGTEKKDDWTCTVGSARNDVEGFNQTTFSLKDAKDKGLYPGKDRSGQVKDFLPWNRETKWMLYCRALGNHLKMYYSDVTMGIALTAEVQDFPASAHRAPRREEGPPPKDDFIDELPETKPPAEFTAEVADEQVEEMFPAEK